MTRTVLGAAFLKRPFALRRSIEGTRLHRCMLFQDADYGIFAEP